MSNYNPIIDYSVYTKNELFKIIETDLCEYKYSIVHDKRLLSNTIIESNKKNKLNFIIIGYFSNIFMINLIKIINNIDDTISIALITGYKSPNIFDMINFVSEYFKQTNIFGLKYFIGEVIYILFSKKKKNIPNDIINKFNNIKKPIGRLYNTNSHIEQLNDFLDKIIKQYTNKIDFAIEMITLKCSDDMRYDSIKNTIDIFKKTVLTEFLDKRRKNDKDDINNNQY
jgi:hypothetical protein